MLILLFLCMVSPTAYAASDVTEGYDENTEITVRGMVAEVVQGMMGPVVLKIRAGNKIYQVVTAPPWYLSREGIVFSPGSRWEVRGSKYFGKDGNLYVIARRLKNAETGREVVLRDSHCKPMWRGHKGNTMRRMQQ